MAPLWRSSLPLLLRAAIPIALCVGCGDPGLESSAEAALVRARALRERAADFDQARALAALGSHPRNGPVVRFDERLADATAEGQPLPPQEGQPFALEFEGDDPVELRAMGGPVERADGLLRLRSGAHHPLITQERLDLDPTSFGRIEIRIRLARGSRFELGWYGDPAASGSLLVDVVDDGEFHVYRIDTRTALRRRLPPGTRLSALWIKPSDLPDDEVAIDYLRLVPERSAYAQSPFGRTYAPRGDELRSVLYMGTPQRLRFAVRVPEQAPRLAFGLGILADGDPVTFELHVEQAGQEEVAASVRVEDSSTWHDREVDLSRWAGQDVELVFAARSAAGNIAFWSNPTLYGKPPERFNVIVLLEDTMRADHLAVYGYERETSPAKDALARRGVVFEHAFSQAPTTRASVPSLMTSLYPSATGVWSHEQMLDDRYVTLAEVMRSQGFVTASFVQNSNAGRSSGLHQGFDHLFERPATEGQANVYGGPVSDWLDRNGHRNFFLYLHVLDPHGVYEPPREWRRWYEELPADGQPVRHLQSLDPVWVDRPTREKRKALYDGEIRYNDAWLSRLLERLEREGLLEHTLFVFVSDHGEHFGEHVDGNQPLDGHRAPGFVQVLNVPLIFFYPPALPEGVRIQEPVQLIDVVPTLLDVIGVDTAPLLLQGDSLLPVIRGRNVQYFRDRIAISEEPGTWSSHDDDPVAASAFYRSWHYLSSRGREGGAPLLFDYRSDPAEQRPLGGRGAERRLLADMLRGVHAENVVLREALTRGADGAIEYEPDAIEQLRELGYID